jgi:PTS system nitrogen regulatory IIA component
MDLTVHDAAAIFDVPESRIYRWIQEDDLPTREVNGRHYFNRTELLEWATIRRVKFDPDLFRDTARASIAPDGLVEALRTGGIVTGLRGVGRAEVLKEVIEGLRLPEGFDRSVLHQLFLAREALGSTAVGDGIAIPHPRHPLVLPVAHPSVTICFLEKGIDFAAPDQKPVHTLFVLISSTIRSHLRILAKIACALRDERFRSVLKEHGSSSEVLRELERIEQSIDRGSAGTGGLT